jgi:hypothetical protein
MMLKTPSSARAVVAAAGTVLFGSSACAGPSASVSVAPAHFDRAYTSRSWYFEVEQRRLTTRKPPPTPSLLVHRGFVCGDEKVHFVVAPPCHSRTTLVGKVWRVASAHCDGAPPIIHGTLLIPEATLIAKLEPVVLWPERIKSTDCDEEGARSYERELLPPIDRQATVDQLWNEDHFWAEIQYQLEAWSE